MHRTDYPFGEYPRDSTRRCRRSAGFTLVEVMLAMMVLVTAGLGVFTVLIHAYHVVTLARYHDNARAVLQTFANQFLRLQTSDSGTSGTYNRILFSPAGSQTGSGLLWDSTSTPSGANLTLDTLSNEPGGPAATGRTGNWLIVTIGGSQNGIPACVTRTVEEVKSDGTTSSTALPPQSAGQLLQATFTINYGTMGSDPMAHYIPGSTVQQCTQILSVVRAAP